MSSPDDGGIADLTAIPDFEVDAIARRLLPKIQEYYNSPEGQKAFEVWKQQHSST